jgi:hypothetical protein
MPGYKRDGLIQVDNIGSKTSGRRQDRDHPGRAGSRMPGVTAVGRPRSTVDDRPQSSITDVAAAGQHQSVALGVYARRSGLLPERWA